mmetsp:Transcript_8356/g.18260  ORF Transcript_8356/g.18260 Transcript_8356/m.18260 type:complete len:539 (-) Transcript_8356:65-1681(-)
MRGSDYADLSSALEALDPADASGEASFGLSPRYAEDGTGSRSPTISQAGSQYRRARFARRRQQTFNTPYHPLGHHPEAEELHLYLIPQLSFVESARFQLAVSFVIAANTVVLGLEVDIEWSYWEFLNQTFLLTFAIEMVLRILYHGHRFFTEWDDLFWNIFDLMVVVLGIIESWVIPLLTISVDTHQPAALVRIFRLSRLLRLLRVFRIFAYLEKFMDAIVVMLPTIFWIFAILFMFVYATAIMLTLMVGHGESFDSELTQALDLIELREHFFSDISTTMFTLFRLLTMDTWHDLAYPLIEVNGMWRLFYVIFISFGSWIMISLLTAVISDHMIAATADTKRLQDRQKQQLKEEFLTFLHYSFQAADVNQDGVLDRQEFFEWVGNSKNIEQLQLAGIDMRREEFMELFDIFDENEDDELSIEEFTDGFRKSQEALSVKHFLVIEHMLKKMRHRESSSFASLKRPLKSLLERVALLETSLSTGQQTLTEEVRALQAIVLDQKKGKTRMGISWHRDKGASSVDHSSSEHGSAVDKSSTAR